MSSNIIGTAGCGKTFDIKSVGEMCDEIKSLKAENKKAPVALDQSYEVNALAQKTIEDLAKKVKNLEINEKVREEKLQELTLMTKHLYDEQGARDCFNLVDQADLEELKAENKKLKAELEEKEEEVSLINSEEMENEEDIAKLKEENKKLKQKATAWDIVNNGTDWQDLRDLCDQQMCEALIKTGECDEEDFEGYDYGQLS
jgi:DNA repair exonuclease SbcCD ATPase subunit